MIYIYQLINKKKLINILEYKFVQFNILVFSTFFLLYWILYKINKEYHYTFDKSYNLTSSLDVAYFTIVTQSTIGYGDILPRSQTAKFIMIVHMAVTIIGLGLLG
jgi:hypothetical protein